MSEKIKNRVKSLLICMLAAMQILQPMAASAGTNGYTEEALSNVDRFYVSSSTNWAYAGASNVTIYLPIVNTNYAEGVTVNDPNASYWSEISTLITELNTFLAQFPGYTPSLPEDIAKAKELYDAVFAKMKEKEDWADLDNLLNTWENMSDTEWGTNKPSNLDVAGLLFQTTGNYNTVFPATCFKEGYNLINYKMSTVGTGISIGNLGIMYVPMYLEPIWAKTDAFYGTIEELKVGDELKPGSIIYGIQYSPKDYESITKKPFLYTVIGHPSRPYVPETVQILGSAVSKQETAALSYNSNLTVSKVPDSYNGTPVIGWKIISLQSAAEYRDAFKAASGLSYGYITVTNDWNATLKTEQIAENIISHPSGGGYVSKEPESYMIELDPIFDNMILTSPTVSMEGYNLHLETVTPVSKYGTVDYSGCKDDVKDYFYVTRNKDLSIDEVKADSSITYTEYTDSINKVLHPGEYRVFTYSSYTDNKGNTTYSDTSYTDIVVEVPILEAVTISENNKIVSYKEGSVTTANGITDYSKEKINLNHFITNNGSFNDADINNVFVSGDFSQTDTVSAGYNKVYANSFISIPASMMGDAPKKIYSSTVSEIVYVPYILETPVISENTHDLDITNDGVIATQVKAVNNYVYCDYAVKDYEGMTAEELDAFAIQYNERVPKLDGISTMYAFSSYKETINGVDYYSYSPITQKTVTSPYTINDVALKHNGQKITLASGGYSSPLKPYDTSTIYYIVTNEIPTTEEIQKLISEDNKYTESFNKLVGNFYVTAVEEVVSDSGDGLKVVSTSKTTTIYVPAVITIPAITISNNPSQGLTTTVAEVDKSKQPAYTPENIKTSDDFNVLPYIIVFVLAVGVIVCVILYKKHPPKAKKKDIF